MFNAKAAKFRLNGLQNMLSFGANEDGNGINLFYGPQNEPSQWLHQSCKSEDNNKQERTEKNRLKTAAHITYFFLMLDAATRAVTQLCLKLD